MRILGGTLSVVLLSTPVLTFKQSHIECYAAGAWKCKSDWMLTGSVFYHQSLSCSVMLILGKMEKKYEKSYKIFISSPLSTRICGCRYILTTLYCSSLDKMKLLDSEWKVWGNKWPIKFMTSRKKWKSGCREWSNQLQCWEAWSGVTYCFAGVVFCGPAVSCVAKLHWQSQTYRYPSYPPTARRGQMSDHTSHSLSGDSMVYRRLCHFRDKNLLFVLWTNF